VIQCSKLMNADVPYKVAQFPESRNLYMRVKWRYEIGVLQRDYERAKGLLGIDGEFEDDCYDLYDLDDAGETEDADLVESLIADNSAPGAEVRNEAYLKPWYPEDATVEVWSQDGDDISGGVAMALKENLIHCRVDHHDGLCKAFVMPEDEARAREIVREVVEGLPD